VKALGRRPEVCLNRLKVEFVGWAPPLGRTDEEVIQLGLTVPAANQRKTTPAQRCQHRLGHAGRKRGSDRGVDRVPTLGEDLGPRARCDRMSGSYAAS
jgi:hypothetical protein